MAEHTGMQQIVERAVAQALEGQLPQLRANLVQRVVDALPATAAEAPPAARSDVSGLVKSVAYIHAGTTQKEILRALLTAGSERCARIALFVVKGGAATGWQSRGFGEDEVVKDFALDMAAGPVAHAYQNRVATPGNIAEMDARFVEQFGGPSNEQVLVLPLALKEKVAALVYADGGESGVMDAAALELLVLATSAWLEVTSLRKQTGQKEVEAPAHAEPAPQPVQVSSFSDPFAGHAPKHTVSARVHEPEPVAEVVEVAASHAAAAAATATDPLAGLSAEEADMHRKAQRFARLLVDEIKLYNQAKVAEGRRHRDLYDRLKPDIEKSRATYTKRYGNTAAASVDYFQQELLRSLGEDDASLMGANFHR
ncbi:MAG TPA: hypothetical protein VMU61_07805 [Candidatus Aquilonibacter sp.]|nr:hypothetical protein [Candidatus Aquilonibacter sp.]